MVLWMKLQQIFYSNNLCSIIDFFGIEIIFSDDNFLKKSKEKIKSIFDLYFERVNLESKLELDPTLRGAGGFGSTGLKE